jgi:hypothetical protein
MLEVIAFGVWRLAFGVWRLAFGFANRPARLSDLCLYRAFDFVTCLTDCQSTPPTGQRQTPNGEYKAPKLAILDSSTRAGSGFNQVSLAKSQRFRE